MTGHLVEASISRSSARAVRSGGVAGLSEAARLEAEAMERSQEGVTRGLFPDPGGRTAVPASSDERRFPRPAGK